MSKENETKQRPFNVVLLGDAKVGKTALLFQFNENNNFYEQYRPTKYVDFAIKELRRNNESPVNVQLWDTPGNMQPQAITETCLNNANLILICFDANNTQSLTNALDIHLKKAKQYVDQSKIILIGTKHDKNTSVKNLTVVKAWVKKIVNNNYKIPFFATSAKDGNGLIEAITYGLNKAFKRDEEALLDPTLSEACLAIHAKLEQYQKAGPKFGFFTQNESRNAQITAIKNLSPQSARKLAKTLYREKLQTIASHKNHSIMASLGITTSRLAETLEDCLQELVNKKLLSKDELKTIKGKVTDSCRHSLKLES